VRALSKAFCGLPVQNSGWAGNRAARVSFLASDQFYGGAAMNTNRSKFSPASARAMVGAVSETASETASDDAARAVASQAVRDSASTLARQWSAVQDAAEAVGMMAGLAKEEPDAKCRNFAMLIRDVEGWRLALAKNHVADMTAMMQPGLAALLATNARGQDATAAALTLWHEYFVAREAVLKLLPETGKMGPRRSA